MHLTEHIIVYFICSNIKTLTVFTFVKIVSHLNHLITQVRQFKLSLAALIKNLFNINGYISRIFKNQRVAT